MMKSWKQILETLVVLWAVACPGTYAAEARTLGDLFLSDNRPSTATLFPVFIPTEEGDLLYGYMNDDLEMCVPPRFSEARPFYEGLAAVGLTSGTTTLYGYIDTSGTLRISPRFELAWDFSEGLAPVLTTSENGYQWGFIDTQGEWVIEPQFSSVGPFRCGVARVFNHAYTLTPSNMFDFTEAYNDWVGWGYVNHSGQRIVTGDYLAATHFSEGYGAIEKATPYEWGGSRKSEGVFVVDALGRFLNMKPFRNFPVFSEGLAFIQQEDFSGYMNADGERVIDLHGAVGGRFSEGLAFVFDPSKKGSFRYIDRNGNVVFDLPDAERTDILMFNLIAPSARERVYRNQWMDSARNVMDFHDGIALIAQRPKQGHAFTLYNQAYIDKNGRVLRSGAGMASGFENGLAWTWALSVNEKEEGGGVLNTKGEILRGPYQDGFPILIRPKRCRGVLYEEEHRPDGKLLRSSVINCEGETLWSHETFVLKSAREKRN